MEKKKKKKKKSLVKKRITAMIMNARIFFIFNLSAFRLKLLF